MVAKPAQPDITGKYAAYLRENGMSCHFRDAWRDEVGGCSHPDHLPMTLAITRGDVNVIEMALRFYLIQEAGSEPLRESVKNTLRKVESMAVPKGGAS
jgi:hypothetical protein